MRTLLCILLAAGCSSGGGGYHPDGSSADLSTAGDIGGNPDMGPGYYLPTGYTLTPFLSADPEHSFASADQVLGAKDYLAVLETDAGRLVLDLYETKTPITVNSFVFLTLHHFYDGVAFHRVIDNFMAQTGDPNSIDGDFSGQGDPGYFFGLEIDNTLHYDATGVLGMARRASPDTNGSQFFITFNAYPSLDGQYTIFGKLIEGAEVLPKIARGMPPTTPTRITRAYIVEK
jgi:cyclophilin family peptidyl-prolyl cis-trans isomerase